MPWQEAPCVELGTAPKTESVILSPSPSEISSASSPEPHNIRATPLFRALAMPPPEPYQPPGQDELEQRLPGYRRIVIPRESTLIELLKQCSGVTTDEEVLQIREATLRVVAERVGLRRLNVLAPILRSLVLDGSAISSLRDLGIGLVHLKLLSVNRCGLTSLDGIWGFTVLKELHAANNKIHDLQPLGALQKLNSLNLANNPISESSRLWTLGVCSSLRKLVLRGTPVSESLQYRSQVATILPMLVYLDELPLHTDVEYGLGDMNTVSSGSDSEDDENRPKKSLPSANYMTPFQSNPGPSSGNETTEFVSGQSRDKQDPNLESGNIENEIMGPDILDFDTVIRRRRPNTTEGIGPRVRPNLPPRPQTANNRPSVEAPTKLQILNTLMDEEWRCSGSKLTSLGTVCGNLARALRQNRIPLQRRSWEANLDAGEQTMSGANRAAASEIPRANRLEDWVEFTQRTGIEIDIDFNKRPTEGNAVRAIERLEQIEMETRERLQEEAVRAKENPLLELTRHDIGSAAMSSASDCELWNVADTLTIVQQCDSDIIL